MKKRIFITSIVIILSVFLSASIGKPIRFETDKDQIISLIESYFELKYYSIQDLELKDFSSIIVDTTKGNAFFKAENEKLEIEIYHGKIFQLGYLDFEFFLDFENISLSNDSMTATVDVIEGHDVVFEISAPQVSSMRNLNHKITLQKIDGEWKITSDIYDDYLWRMLRSTEKSKAEIMLSIDESMQMMLDNTNNPQNIIPNSIQPLQTTSIILPYNRSGAVAYAHQWALTRNPNYHDFSQDGGDCTNFVSQAIHEGGGAQMVGSNTYGWYYHSSADYAAAWTGVSYLYDFITQYWVWPAGPEGYEVGKDDARPGDLIQYDWEGDYGWDHSTIIVQSDDMGYGEMLHMMASHTPDCDNYPFYFWTYGYVRFVHIDHIESTN